MAHTRIASGNDAQNYGLLQLTDISISRGAATSIVIGSLSTATEAYPGFFSAEAPILVEIGTSTVHNDSKAYGMLSLSANVTTATTSVVGVIAFVNQGSSGNDKRLAIIAGRTETAISSGRLEFYTTSAGTAAERMRIDHLGVVAINTSTPASPGYKLHVEGGHILVNNAQFVAVNAGDVITTTNNSDTTFILSMVGSGQARFKTDFSGRYMSFAPDAGTTDVMVVRSGRVGMGSGVGLSPPIGQLYINKTVNNGLGGDVWIVNNSNTNPGSIARLSFNSGNNGASSTTLTNAVDSTVESGGSSNSLSFQCLGTDGSTNTKWTISGNGRLSNSNQVAESGNSVTPQKILAVTPAAHGPINNLEAIDIDFAMNRTVTFKGAGSFAVQRAAIVRNPTYAGNGGSVITITEAATLTVTDAPTQGTDAVLTNKYAFWVQAGLTKLDGGLNVLGLVTHKNHSNFTGSETKYDTTAVTTSNGTQTTSWTLTLADTTLYWATVTIEARESTGTDRALFERKVLVYRQGGGATIEGVVQTVGTDIFSAGAATWAVSFTVSGNDVRVSVTGAIATTIYWVGTVKYQAVATNS